MQRAISTVQCTSAHTCYQCFASAPAPTRTPAGAEFCDAFDFGGSPDPNSPNILEVAIQNPELSVIVSLIELTDLDAVFGCPGKLVTP